MRRTLAAAILGLSLWIGSLAWSGFIMTSTILNPDRSRDVAEALLEDDAVRDQIVDNIADGVDDAVPSEVPLGRATVEAGARTALDSPVVEEVFVRGLVQAHRAFLGEAEVPRSVDGTEFGAAARDSLVSTRPELAGLVPDAPSLAIPLPTERIPDAGPVRRFLLTAVPILALGAALGAVVALVITTNRPAVIRRAGIWAIALSVFVLVFAYGIPAAAQRYAPDQAAVIAALVGALARATRGPAVALFVAGLAGLALSMLWRPAAAVVTAPVDGGRRNRSQPRPRPASVTPDSASRPGRRRRVVDAGPPRRPTAPPAPPRTMSTPDPTTVWGPSDDATRVQPSVPASPRTPVPPTPRATTRPTAPTPAATPSGATAGSGDANGAGERIRPGARHVEGVGWVHDGSGPIPPDARWLPGVGYVLDR